MLNLRGETEQAMQEEQAMSEENGSSPSADTPLRRAITRVKTDTNGGNGGERTVPFPLVSVRFVGVRSSRVSTVPG
jgi:hypothetical protein